MNFLNQNHNHEIFCKKFAIEEEVRSQEDRVRRTGSMGILTSPTTFAPCRRLGIKSIRDKDNSHCVSIWPPGMGILVIIDPTVESYQMLASGVLAGAKVVILNSEEDEVRQITRAILDYPVNSLHIVCHGSPGSLQLGNTKLSISTLTKYEAELKRWGETIGSGGILLYGCEVGAGDIGKAFVGRFHELSGVGVAGAVSPVGNAELGGSWELGVKVGEVGDNLAFGEEVLVSYPGVLPENLLFASQIEPVNTAPTANNSNIRIDEDTTYNFSITDFDYTDSDGDPLTEIEIVNLPERGELLLAGSPLTPGQTISATQVGTLSYRPEIHENGDNYTTFPVIFNNGSENSNQATITINVNSVNDPPVSTDDNIRFEANITGQFQFQESNFPIVDVDGDNLASITIAQEPTLGSLTLNDEPVTNPIPVSDIDQLVYSIEPTPAGNNIDEFTFTVNDGQADSLEYTININVGERSTDTPPTAADAEITIEEDTTFQFNTSIFNFRDEDGDFFSNFNITRTPELGRQETFTDEGVLENIFYIPNHNEFGNNYTNLEFQIGDSGGLNSQETYTLNINVTPVNDNPVFTSGAPTTATVGQLYTYQITANDIDEDRIDINSSNIPGWLQFTDNGNGTATLTGTPTDQDIGNSNIELTVTDPSDTTDTQIFSLQVTGPQAPTNLQISGTKFNDINNNGVLDFIEPGLAGVTIYVDINNNQVLDNDEPRVVTNSEGSYLFENISLDPGTYSIRDIPPVGLTQTVAAPTITVNSGSTTFTNIDIANIATIAQSGSISGTKFNDLNGDGFFDPGEPPLEGFTIYVDFDNSNTLDADEPFAITNTDGTYTINNIPAGNYTVREVQQTGFTQTTPDPIVTVVADQNISNINLGNFQSSELGSISGVKFQDDNQSGFQDPEELGLPGFRIYLDQNNNNTLDANEPFAITNTDGTYTINNIPAGNYTVREVQQTGFTQTTPDPIVTVVADQNISNINFGNFQSPELGSISGVKFQDDNQSGFQDPEELGLPGFRIYLDQNNNNTLDANEPFAITNTDGTYTINNIPAGNYTVREVQQTGFTQTTPDPIVTVVADQNISNINFGNFQQETVDAFIVNSIGDEGDANLNDGVPLTATGVVTLRSAIEQANFLPGENTIDFDPNILFGQTITLNTQLDITSDIIINGLGANNLTISGNNASRVFNIQAPPPPIIDAPILNALQLNIVSPTVTISGLTITDGVVSNEQGGGIRNIEGNVTLANSTVTGNTALSGGGVYTQGGTLTIANSLISNNIASFGAGIINDNTFAPDAYGNSILVNTGVLEVNNTTISNNIATNAELSGGGIDNDGIATVTNSTISGNTSGFDGGGIDNDGTATVNNSTISENVASRFGGGINNDGTVTVTDSTISGNSANASGGGIANDGTTTFTNSTISGNSANASGGGIYNNGRNTFYDGINFVGATATITNSTITQNIADNDRDNIGNGGGIANGGTANVSNSIIAGNFDASSTIILSDVSENFNDTLVGVFNSNGSNLVGDILGSSGFAPSEVLQVPVNSVLDPNLGNNGGLTLTHALIQDINNPAIDGGNNANILPGVQFDQRGNGFPRTLDGDGDGIAVVDVGAFEASQIETELLVNISGTKFNDLDNDGSLDIGEPSLPGVTVYIDINNNNFPDNNEPTAVTDAFGFYSFNNISLLPDTYNIRDIPPPDFIQAAPIPTITVDIASTNFPNFNIANIEVSSFIVNDTRDAGDLIPGNGIVETALGDNIVTLRAAIEEANAFPGENTIEFESSLSGQTITLSNVELDITSNIIINGLGANNLTISGNNASRIFDIQESTVTINDLAIADGFVFGEEEGGGIRNIGGIVTVNNSTIRNSQGFNGGGISNRDGVLTVNNSTVSGNNSSGNGGAISSQGGADGELTINNSTISGNTSIGLGGGIYINTPASISDIASNTIVLNTAIDGGGVFIAGGATRIEQSIIVGNNSNNVSGSFLGIENVIDVPIESVLETALQNNGGPTETHNLIPGSPAIDTALGNTFNLDQRGIQRPIDGDGDGNAIADIGAVETSQITLVGSISGIKFNDLDSDGFFDAGEPGLAGVTIYLDLNENQQFDPEEPSEITNDTGNYSFSNLNSGTYNVREVVPEDFRPTLAPETPITITAAGENFTNINFGNTTNIAGISITQTGGSTDVAEEGTTSDTYEIALNSIPTAPVNITIASDGQTVLSDVDETLSNTINLTFNDLTPQTVTVTAVDDEIESPDISNITHTISSNDENYNGANVPFTIDDIPSNNILPVNIIDSDIENLAPDAIDDTAFTTVNNQVNIDVLDNDTDPELDQIDIIDFDATSTAGGTVTLSTDENENPSLLLYFPPDGFIGEDTFTYTISDGNNNTDIATVTINVISPGEQRPIANSDTATTTQGNPVTINVLENDTDPQDSPVEILATTDPSNGAIANNNNGTITYTPLPEAIGEDTFTYTIIDPEGNISEPATVTVAVDPLPPGSISGTVFDDLNDNDILDPGETGLNNVTVTISGIENDIPIQQTTVTDSSGIYNFSNLLPNIEYTLTAVRSPDLPLQEFPFPVTIPAGESVSNINFAYDVSDPGILQFSEPIFSVAENTPTATVTIIRTDGSDGVVSATLNLANGTAIQDIDYGNPISNNIFFADGETQQTVSIPIIDDSIIEGNRTVNLSLSNVTGDATIGQPATAILEILEDEVSPPPIANPDTATTTQGNPPITIDVLANDTGEFLNIITVDNFTTAGNNATINNNQIIYTPLPEFSGTDTFTYEISDGNNNTPNSSATVNVTVDSPPSGSISGIIFNDTNQNGFLELGETALSGVTVFIDTNQNGIPDPNEQTAVTNQSGLYTLSNLLPNTYTVRTITPQPDATLTTQEFSVTLSSGENLNNIDFGYSTANPGILQFSNPTFSVTENEPTATVTVIRTGGNDGVVSANINLSNGTATQGIDYGNPVPETIFFADKETQQTVNIPIVNDDSVENTETVNLSLSNVTGGATIGQPATATLEIIDDDEIISSPPPPFTTRVLGFDGEFNNFDFVRSVQVNPPQGPANLRFSPNTVALVSRNQGGQGRFDGTTNNSTVIAYDIPDRQLGFELDAIVIDLAEVIERIGEIEFGNFSLDYASPNRSHNVRFFNESRQDIGQGATLSRTIPVPGQPNNFSNFSRQGISIPEDTQFIAIGSESTEIGIDNLQFTLQPKRDSDRSFSQISLASMPETQLVGNITTIDSLLDSMFFASAI
ncbi:DUF4347 domain-containing protein [Okeania hirsuta]|uniref:DUF4347 domain-containing protein n=1 Tax=Okeania hirsuta TaxID=1458930 RepID=A0A3N6PK78_9CYAN|nr:SdrD B-like domain-containing protein [Okeania hirsuta]RQH27702.1 DUF4347 domain-containing protein [Okeania hirsuta]